MAKFNIIYKSPSGDYYISSGTTLDKIGSKDRIALLYSGKSIGENAIDSSLSNSKKVIALFFPDDNDPNIKAVEIGVS